MILWKEFFSKVIVFKKIEKRSLLGNAFLLKHNQYRPGKYGLSSESEPVELLLVMLLLLLSEVTLLPFFEPLEEACSAEVLFSILIADSEPDINSDELSD